MIKPYSNFFKRVFDFTLSTIGVLTLSPLLLCIALLVLIINKGKPFFYQQRPGKDACMFRVVKFKTMDDRKDAKGNMLAPAQRITTVGRFLRAASLDELPQLWNVIKGDMSLVGPRPLLVEYLPLYNDFQKRRHEVRPGITGWAQVNGRNAISWEQKFEYDIYYVDNLSFVLDVKILWMTFLKVFRREGINSNKHTTMEEFLG